MKTTKLIKAFLGALLLLASNSVLAIPLLQIYIEGANYDSGSETWAVSTGNYKLWVIGNVDGPGGKGTISDVKLAAAFSSNQSGSITLTPTTTNNFGAFTDPSTPSSPIFLQQKNDGSSPVMSDGASLPSHGIYGAGTSFMEWSLGNFTLTDSPIADFINAFPEAPAVTQGQINAYNVAVSGYSDVHFDAYGQVQKGSNVQATFAPFSHDAEGDGNPVIGPNQLPEPGTLFLSALGLFALAAFAHRQRTK